MKILIIFLVIFSLTTTVYAQEQQESTMVLKDRFIGDFDMAASGNNVFVAWIDFDGVSTIGLIVGMYAVVPISLVWQLKKRK